MATKKTTTSEIKFGADDEKASITFGADDQPAAKGELPKDVKPSTGGGGRGSVNPELPAAPRVRAADPFAGIEYDPETGNALNDVKVPKRSALEEGALRGAAYDEDELNRQSRRNYQPSNRAAQGESIRALPGGPGERKAKDTRSVGEQVVTDAGLGLVKGAIAVPEAVVGLSDMLNGGASGRVLEKAGFRPKEAKAILTNEQSDELKAGHAQIEAADGLGATIAAALANPRAIGDSVVESLPAIGAGGVAGRALQAVGVRGGLAAAGGEGFIGMGGAAEQNRQADAKGELSLGATAASAASGVGTAAFGLFGNKMAKSLGVHDVDTLMLGVNQNPKLADGVATRVLKGMFAEGFLEELPQSIHEQVMQNVAQGKPIGEGIDKAAVMGTLAGAGMGGAANLRSRGGQPAAAGPQPLAATQPTPASNRAAGGGIPAVPAAVPAATPVASVAPTAPVPPAEPQTASGKPAGALARAAARTGATPGNPVLMNGDPEKAQEAADKVLELEKQDDDARRMDEAMAGDIAHADAPFDRIPDGDLIANDKDKEKWKERQAREPDRSHETTTETTTDEAPTTPAPAPAVPVSPVREEASAASSVDEGGPATVAATAGQADAAASSQQEPAQDRNADVGRVDGPPDAQGAEGSAAVQPAATPAVGRADRTTGKPVANLADVADAQRPAGVPDRKVGGAGAPGGKASDQPAARYNSIEDATAFIREQRARGTSIAAVPVITEDGEITVAVKGTPDYERGVDQRQERNAKKANEQAGILDGDTLHPKTGKPWTTKGSAVRAAKDMPGMEPAEVKNGFVLRKAAPAAIEKEATNDSASDDVRMADAGGARSGRRDDDGGVGNRVGTADAAPARADAKGAAAAGAKGVVRDAGDGADSALTDPATGKAPASWVLRDKTTGEVQMETSDPKKVAALNTAKYEAVPVGQHLQEVNDPTSLAGRVARSEKVSAGTAPEHKPTTGAKTEQFTSPALTTARTQVEAAQAEWDSFSGEHSKHLIGKNKKRKPGEKAPAEVKERFARYEAMRDAASHAYNAALTSAKMGVAKGKPVTVDDASLKDGAAVPMTMDTKNFKVITDEWAALFADPAETTKMADKAKAETLTPAAAKARIADWKAHAKAQGADPKTRSANAEKTVISLFDLTGEWSRPWEEAGYNVLRFDLQSGQDVMDFSVEHFTENYDISDVYAILAATPCTDFASSGAKHFLAKDKQGQTEQSVALVNQTAATIEYFRPPVWALENPVGRIQNLTGLPDPRLSFDPAHFGDPYTKKTMIWGNFNADLPAAPVEATEGSKMHSMFGGKSIETKNARSETPEGFSYAFFMANNYADMPAESKLASQYPEASGAVQEALKAGVTEARIHELMDDTYGNYEYEDARTVLAEEVAKQAPPPAPPPAPKPAKPKAEKKAKPAAQEATGSLPATDAPIEVTPHATNKAEAGYIAEMSAIARHFRPGNIVKSYGGGHDRVVRFQPTTVGEPWRVYVHAVVKKGDEWVNDPREDERWHRTRPDANEQKNGVVQEGPKVKVPTYAERKVNATTAAALVDWAKSQGFTKVLKPEDMHITVANSEAPMDALDAGVPVTTVRVAAGKREVKQMGDSIVLTLKSPVLERRWQEWRDAGASWSYPTYQPHVSIALADEAAVDLSKVAPYTGPLEFAHEQSRESVDDFTTKTVTVATAEKQADAAQAETDPKAIAAEQRANAAAARKTTAKKVGWQKAQQREANPFRAFLAERGISVAIAGEWLPGAKERQSQGMVPGWGPMFRKNGLDLDMLAEAAVADGFMPEPDVQRLHAMIGQQFSGKRIVPAYGRDAEGYMEASLERQRQFEQEAAEALADVPREAHDAIMEEADSLPFYSTGNETDLAQAMAAMDFTPEEIQDAIAEEQGAPAQDGQGRGEAGQAASGEAREGGQGSEGAASGQGNESGVRATGRPAAGERAGQVETPAFKAWFGDSKVVDDAGKPMVVYHGTIVRPDGPKVKGMGNITAFDRMFTTQFRAPSLDTVGSWFSTNPGEGGAAMYSGKGEGSAIYPVYLNIRNPQVTTFQLMQARARKLANGKDDGRVIGAPEVEAYRKWLEATGKDGIKIEASGNEGSTEFDQQTAWIALEPGQIKSATGNAGTFDGNSADIRLSVASDRKAAKAAEKAAAAEQARDAAFKRWSNDAPLVTSGAANAFNFKTGEKIVVEAFHGTKRPDRIGGVFDPKRATSGPMAYFTSSPELASTYAQGKSDTSLSDEDQAYGNWFKVNVGGKREVSIDRAWYFLTPEQKATIAKRMPDVRLNDDLEAIYEEGGGDPGSYDYELKQTQRGWDKQGNPLAAAVETWLNSGNLFDNELEFMKVLKLAGFPMQQVRNDFPTDEFPGVYKTFIAMQKPLVVADMPADLMASLEQTAKKDRGRVDAQGADMWDKRTRTVKDWLAQLKGEGMDPAYAWTSIPDKVTAVFKAHGYDGIVDWSGKGGGHQHPVYIPFGPTQIKNALGNKGTFNADKKDINLSAAERESTAIPTVLASAERATVAERMARFIGESFRGGNNRFKAVEPGPKADRALAQNLAAVRVAAKRLFGHDVVFVQFDDPSTALFNGAFSKRIPGTVFVRIDAQKPHMAVMGHELLHSMRAQHPDLYDALYKELETLFVNELAEYGQNLADRYAEHGQELPEDWHEEVIADLVGDNFMKPEFWAGMAESNRPLARKIADAIVAFLDRVLAHLKSTDPMGSTPFFSDATAARRAVTSTMRQWSNRVKDAPAPMQAPTLPSLALAKAKGAVAFTSRSSVKGVVYHATEGDFSTFDTNRSDMGVHLGSAEQANFVADRRLGRPGAAAGPNVMPVYIDLRRPLRLKDVGSFHADGIAPQLARKGIIDKALAKKIESEYQRDWKTRKVYDPIVRKAIQDAGYDGLVYANTTEGKGDSYAVFEPNQIKSATGNNGNFDAGQDDIRLSITGQPAAAAPAAPKAQKSLAEAIFGGSKAWTRDQNGKPVKLAEQQKKYEAIDTDERGQMLLRKGIVSAKQLATWKASKLDIFNGAVNKRFRQHFESPGVLWTDAELKGLFKLDDAGIAKYRELRAQADTIISQHALADMLKATGVGLEPDFYAEVMAMPVDLAAEALRDHLMDLAEGERKPGSGKEPMTDAEKADARARAAQMKVDADAAEADAANAPVTRAMKDLRKQIDELSAEAATQPPLKADETMKKVKALESDLDTATKKSRGSYFGRAAGLREDAEKLLKSTLDEELPGFTVDGRALMKRALDVIDIADEATRKMEGGHLPPDIANTIVGEPWTAPGASKADKFIYEVQDGLIDLKRVQEAITAEKGKIEEQFDARLAETLYAGKVAKQSTDFFDDEVEPLLKDMTKAKVTQQELGDFLHARAAPERNEQIAKVNPEMPDGGAGSNSKGLLLTTAAAKKYIADLPADRRAALEAMGKRIDAITAKTRQLLVDGNLEDADTIAAWEKVYKHYVPMFREDVEFNRMVQHKRATGSERGAVNILAHVLQQREASVKAAEKNRIAIALYGLALANPNPKFWSVIRPGMQEDQIAADLTKMGIDPLQAESGMGLAPSTRTVDPITNLVKDVANPMYRNLPTAITIKVKGEARVLMLNPEDARAERMALAFKGKDNLLNDYDLASSTVGKVTRWMAAVNTQYNPAFGLVNFARDTLGGIIHLSNTDIRYSKAKVMASLPGALAGITAHISGHEDAGKWSRLFEQFLKDGAQTGFTQMFEDGEKRAADVEKKLKQMARGKADPRRVASMIGGLLSGFNEVTENAVRLAAYAAALDKGLSRPEAARLAKELTVDFNRKGRSVRAIGPLYAFLNAAIQGNERTYRALKGPAGKKILASGVMLGVLQALMLAGAGYDDEDLPEFVKARAFIIPLYGKEKRYISIPLPLGLHVLPNTGRVIAEMVLGDGRNLGKKVWSATGEIASAFNPLGGGDITTIDGFSKIFLPTIVDPMIEVAANKNFAGTPIERVATGERDVRPGVARARESTQRSTTGQAYMGIADAINTMTGGNQIEKGLASPTPEMVRYIAQTAAGGVLRETEKIINSSTAAARGDKVPMSGIPVLGRFAGTVDADQSGRSQYAKNVNAIEALEAQTKAARKAGNEAVYEKLRADPLASAIPFANRAQSAVAKLNKKAVATIGDPEAMREIDASRADWQQRLNENVKDVMDKPTLGKRVRAAFAGQ